MSKQIFQNLKNLPIPLHQTQCVLHKHELLICGVKLTDNNKDSNETTLLSFGGVFEHALVMRYVSVWNNENDKDNELGKLNNYNQWIPFTDNQNRPIHIGGSVDCFGARAVIGGSVNCFGARAVIGGSNNHLLFITHRPCCISVFDLSIFQFIKHDTLSIAADLCFHCFVLRSENGQEMMRENEKKDNEMLLFCGRQDYQLNIMKITTRLNFIKYLAQVFNTKKKWSTFKHTLPIQLPCHVGILNEDNTYIHIIESNDDENNPSMHIKTKVSEWMDPPQLVSFHNPCFIIKYKILFMKMTNKLSTVKK
ncbi:hypothetical protein RFI_04659 [Reticulomyxa filosa]|uniref:Uncharacterized protein n=1 Tax=Reticulomyxa filosa TaxID=46433 RepID=X6P306_RETFI|nr:hypothetical protein RFI_04659 [Reticulomyxa filosa]|eukprot:ETO32459.1 hypothetical protein RFI_04659 [Reticulomyxa filosa]